MGPETIEPELVPSLSAEDLKDLNVKQFLGHFYSTKNKEASYGVQQCIVEALYISLKRDRVKSDDKLQKILKKNKITYARTRRSRLICFYQLVEKYPLLKKIDTDFKPSAILIKLSIIKAVCETNSELWVDGAFLVGQLL